MKETCIEILGQKWTITEKSESEEERLKNCDGFCDWSTRRIVIEREMNGNLDDMEQYVRKVKRHEIVHAFAIECGLHECSLPADSWANNEEMVDWFARMGERIYRAWRDAGALSVEQI